MADTISWAFNAAATSGATSKASGQLPVEAVLVASRSLPKGTTPVVLDLQLDTGSKVLFLAITSSRPDVTAVGADAGATPLTLSGPLVLHGTAVALFAKNLATISLTSPGAAAEVSILVGLKLV